MPNAPELPILPFETAEAWETWLSENWDTAPGVWLQFRKVGSGMPTVTYVEAVEAALCHGWIDGQAKGFDATSHLQRFTRRRARSIWSKINVGRAERLIAEGRMREGGLREVERAKADGRWEAAYEPPSTITVPDDLTHALSVNPEAKAFFETLTGSNRYAILHRLHLAKRPETRERRLRQFVEMLERCEKIHG